MADIQKVSSVVTNVNFSEQEVALGLFTKSQIKGGIFTLAVIAAELFLLKSFTSLSIKAIMYIICITAFVLIAFTVVRFRGKSLGLYLLINILNADDIYYTKTEGMFADEERITKEGDSLGFIDLENENQKKDSTKGKCKRTTQSILPFVDVLEDGIIEVSDKTFALVCKVEPIDYVGLSLAEKRAKYEAYKLAMNSITSKINYQEIIINEPLDIEKYEQVLVPKTSEKMSGEEKVLAKDFGNVQMNNVRRSINRVSNKRMYLVLSYTLTAKLDNYDCLYTQFKTLKDAYALIDAKIEQLDKEEVFSLFYDLNNPFDRSGFAYPENYKMLGRTIKDYIAPYSLNFKLDSVEMGSEYVRILGLSTMQTDQLLADDLITNITKNNYNLMVSKHVRKLDKNTILSLLRKRQASEIERKGKRETENKRTGMTGISYNVEKRLADVTKQIAELNDAEQEIFEVILLIGVFAETKEELDNLTKIIKEKALSENRVRFDILNQSQKEGYLSLMPCAVTPFAKGVDETISLHLMSDSAACMIPFNSKIFFDESGLYYGIDDISQYPLVIDRNKGLNANGFTLGTSGGGKSFSSKLEDLQILYKFQNDHLIIFDPEGEYSNILSIVDGEELVFSASSKTKINVFEVSQSELDSDSFDFSEMVAVKTETLSALMETMKGEPLDAYEYALIHSLTIQIFENLKISRNCAKDVPTLDTFYNLLRSKGSAESDNKANILAEILSCYLDENSMLKGRSTVSFTKRFTILNFSSLQNKWRSIANTLLLSLCEERSKLLARQGIRMWIKADEFHTFFVSSGSAETLKTAVFFKNAFQRFRKLGHRVQGITQNVSELLMSAEARVMLANATFITLLRQSPKDLEIIADMYHLTDNQCKYLENARAGEGLILFEGKVIRFTNRIDRNSLTYKLLNTTK